MANREQEQWARNGVERPTLGGVGRHRAETFIKALTEYGRPRSLIPALRFMAAAATTASRGPALNATPGVHTDDDETAPAIAVLSVRRGSRADTFRLEIEVSMAVAEWLGRAASAFWPVFGAVDEKRKADRDKAARHARIEERLRLFARAGRIGYHRVRKAISPSVRGQAIEDVMARFNLERPAVELAITQYGQQFRKRVRDRRRRSVLRFHARGLNKREIASLVNVHPSTVDKIIRESEK